MDRKQAIIDALDTLRKREIATNEPFKARAYANVIAQLKNHPTPIIRYEDVNDLKGIGETIGKKIKEILEKKHAEAEAEAEKETNAMEAWNAFQHIYGVGPVKATDVVKKGIRSIPQLREQIQTNPTLLNDKQKIGLMYYEDLLERIPRSEMEEHEEILRFLLPPSMKQYEMNLVGSFRRQAMSSGDIDVLLRVPKTSQNATQQLARYVDNLKKHKYIEQMLALGAHKCMAICRLPNGTARRLDVLLTPDQEYAYSMLYFTGSESFNVGFRQHALSKGYTLNEHSLKSIREGVCIVPYMATEKDIFQFLGLRYVEPSQRIDSKQIQPIRIKIPLTM
jgi:DNA polymerase/3'-5' exonuclease PolX